MRRKLIAGNWKMNLGYKDSEKLAKEILLKTGSKELNKTDVLICPSFVSLGIVNKVIKDSAIKIGAQNLYFENDGAYTGEISASMLKSVGCEYVITGHSERRKYMHETNSIINKKMLKAHEKDLKVILCVGETLIEREDEIYEGIVEKQLMEGLVNVTEEQMKNTVIAYEPVWAIGTGLNATPEQASSMHKFIGNVIQKLYGDKTANEILIIYGGSVNLKNSRELLSSCGIDGALIGGASLKADEFSEIVNIASKLK
ncbi:MAG TPA: triose-phosphate isomerase [Ignavibacteria bacterium]|nr:triose-phosphate isomerase [Ignavibacteria bacterium]